jgi:hypothetical protein
MFSNDLIWSLYEVLVPIQIYLNSSLIICQLIYYIKEKELFIIKEKSDHIKVASIFIILFFLQVILSANHVCMPFEQPDQYCH